MRGLVLDEAEHLVRRVRGGEERDEGRPPARLGGALAQFLIESRQLVLECSGAQGAVEVLEPLGDAGEVGDESELLRKGLASRERGSGEGTGGGRSVGETPPPPQSTASAGGEPVFG